MKKSKVLSVLVGATALLGFAGSVFAAPFDDIHSVLDVTGFATTTENVTPFATNSGSNSVEIFVGDDTSPTFRSFNIGSGIGLASGNIFVTPNTIETSDGHLSDTLNNINSSLSTLGGISSTLGALDTFINQVNSNLFGSSTNQLANASTTVNGYMTKAEATKLDAMPASLPWTLGTSTRSIVTGTGATGFQVSSTRNSTDKYNITVITTASIAGNATGYITLETAPTNSATSTDWVEQGRCGNSQVLTLAITLQSVQGTTCQLVADIPIGYYAKLRSVTTTGTVSYNFVSGQEVLK